MSDESKKDFSSMSGEDLGNAVQSILSDPAFGKLLSELSGGKSPEPERAETPPPKSVPQITPEMMARLPEMMSALAPLVSGMKGGGKDGGGEKSSSLDGEKRKKLLAALKPYLKGSRRDAIDSIIGVTEMTDIIGRFGSIKHNHTDS